VVVLVVRHLFLLRDWQVEKGRNKLASACRELASHHSPKRQDSSKEAQIEMTSRPRGSTFDIPWSRLFLTAPCSWCVDIPTRLPHEASEPPEFTGLSTNSKGI